MIQPNALLAVKNLSLQVKGTGATVVNNIDLTVQRGEVFGIVGESGSGKTLAARAILGLQPPPIQRVAGQIAFEGKDITGLQAKALQRLRGNRIGMVFQEPMTSLNPSMRIGEQLEEGLRLHRPHTSNDRRRLILDMLMRVGIKEPENALTAYPHEFSGGMRQRIMLASVMLLKPSLLIADEPTTALDAVVQRDVMELMTALTRENQTAILMISHDLPMVARYADRVAVMCRGEIVENRPTDDLLHAPAHPYTRKLLKALPHRPVARQIPRESKAIVSVENLVADYRGKWNLLRKNHSKRALSGVSLDIKAGEVVGVVGASGSGKTTLARVIAGLARASHGEILYQGKAVPDGGSDYWAYRLNCQMIFQDPYSSLDPRMTIGQLVGEALRNLPFDAAAKRKRTLAALAEVGLDDHLSTRYPHELSGGQRQRVAIARALIRRPTFVIADEPVSALDVTVRSQVLRLFADLQTRYGFSCMFISHDLSVVEQIADRVVVMQDGTIVEQGDRDAIFDKPKHPYTRQLLSAIPALDPLDGGGVRLRWRLEEDIRLPKSA